jgi:hypothetical protein
VSIPAVSNDRIYVGCEDMNLYCLDLRGREQWRFRTEGAVWLVPVPFDGKVLFPSWDCNIYVVYASTGKLVWKFRTEGDPSPFPPPYESFELAIKTRIDSDFSLEKMDRRYEEHREQEEGTSAYKSRVTYQMGTTYREKGKYQIDSQVEEL